MSEILLPDYLEKIYLFNNKELLKYSFETTKKHYLFFGKNENRCGFLKKAFEKINGIDGICWINLDRSIKRKKYMDFILQYSNIPTYRIEAIDGNKDLNEYSTIEEKYKNNNMTNYEIACTLSHLKALDFIKNLDGKYFAICEDDISLENIKYFKNTDLKKIIAEAPNFNILMVSHIYHNELYNIYTDWNKEYENKNHIAGAGFYILNKKNITDTNNIFNLTLNKIYLKKYIDVADKFIFNEFKTITYNYCFITILCKDSEIHEHHIEHHLSTQENNLKLILKKKF